MAATTTTTTKDITIVGGGIIGCTTAYFLTRHPAYSPATHRITLLEASSSSNKGGRTADSVADPTALADTAAAAGAGGAGDKSVTACRPRKEHDGIASGASGKAGGLLARWAFPRTIAPLSFRLHAELAATHGGAAAWGYRRCTAAQAECRASLVERKSKEAEEGSGGSGGGTKGLHKDHKKDKTGRGKSGAPPELDWVHEDALLAYDEIGGPDDTAQVHPELFTHRMAQLAEEAGACIVTGARVTAINTGGDGGAVQSVTYTVGDGDEGDTTHTLPTTDCVVAAGPWTPRLLPQVPVTASRAHSIVVRAPPPGLSAHALFTSIALPRGFFPEPDSGAGDKGVRGRRALARPTTVEPEIYARPDGTAYACGPTDDAEELPDTAAAVRVDEARCADIAAQVAAISGALAPPEGGDQDDGPGGASANAHILARQACYLPQGGPFIGPVSRAGRGVIVAAGHTCWGIQNAPATGLLVSELVFDGKASSANLAGCLPR